MKFSTCMHQFFDQYLPNIKGVSCETIKAYRYTFTIFLTFSTQNLSVKIEELTVEDLTPKLIFAFLDYLEEKRGNSARTRNIRLAALKSMAKMLRLMYPEYREIADMLLNIPQKRERKCLIGYLTQEEIFKIYESVDLKKKNGFRDYTILHLLQDSGARAAELASLNIHDFNPHNKTLAMLGKGDRYRLIQLCSKVTELVELYIKKYRPASKLLYRNSLFINQRREEFTRHGINRLCKKYLARCVSERRMKDLSPAHSFRHTCAVSMLSSGASITDIKNHLGHENIESTMIYLNLNLPRKKEIQKRFMKYTQSLIKDDPKIDELIDWENKEETLNWLDSL